MTDEFASDAAVPDPTAPTTRAIGAGGELLSGLFWVPDLPGEPTIADLDGGIHVGWVRTNSLSSDDDEEKP